LSIAGLVCADPGRGAALWDGVRHELRPRRAERLFPRRGTGAWHRATDLDVAGSSGLRGNDRPRLDARFLLVQPGLSVSSRVARYLSRLPSSGRVRLVRDGGMDAVVHRRWPIGTEKCARRPEGLLVSAHPVVEVARVSKRFKLFAKPWHRAAEWLSLGRRRLHDDFWALRDISFTVSPGECLGIIGRNGSGKSTLLKILARASQPTAGDFAVRGRMLALLELGAGFSPDLTGRQNVLVSSELLGFPPGYAAGKLSDIEAFAELGEHFDRPVRTYSSGMFVRLAFSTFM